jgi:hypothetical protein
LKALSFISCIFLQCTKNGATTTANIVLAINAIRKSRSRVIFIENIISAFPVLLLDQVT